VTPADQVEAADRGSTDMLRAFFVLDGEGTARRATISRIK